MSNFVPVEARFGIQPISINAASLPSQYQVGQSFQFGQVHPLGTIVRGYDSATTALGEGEFMYLKGVVSTVVGSLVTYDSANATTTLIPSSVDLGQSVAVAMSANVAGQFGWYQVTGVAVIKKSAVKFSPGVKVYIGTTGRVTSVVASGKEIVGALSANAATVASATSTVQILINRSFAESR
jgi:predicted RecA/RadA family phage recombinase